VLERLLRRHPGQIPGGGLAKRAARGGQDEPADVARGLADEALEDGIVLAIDRQDGNIVLRRFAGDLLPPP